MMLSPGVINSYLQNSIKESERAHRSNTILIDIVDLGLESVIPVYLKSFWSSASIKHQLQLASRKTFQNKSFLNKIDMILSGYMTDVYADRMMMMIGVVTKDPELCFLIKEADSRIIPHIAIACQEETERVVVMLNAFDVVTYSLVYHHRFCELGIQELWIKFGIKDGRRNIPIHKVEKELGGEKRLATLGIKGLTKSPP